jgi:hypothetical protein
MPSSGLLLCECADESAPGRPTAQMIVYVDMAVVLRVLFKESDPLNVWGKWEIAYSI